MGVGTGRASVGAVAPRCARFISGMLDPVAACRSGASVLLALAVGGAATAATGSPSTATRPVNPRLAPRPNLLVCIADDWSYGHAGAYSCAWVRTPGFDRVAREGLLFRHAYTPNAKCAPSRACLLTGRNSWQLGAAANHIPFFPPEVKTYPEALAEQGYVVGVTGKGWAPGVANDGAGRPRRMTGRPFNHRTAAPPATGIGNNDYAANFADFLATVPRGQPWCFWLGAVEPHRPYEYGSGVAKGGRALSDPDRVPGYWPDTEVVRNDLLDYAFEVEHFDRHVVRSLELLADRGEETNTLVVVTSDHGMPFPRVKGQAYDCSNRLPLAIRWPGGIRKPGRVVEDPVSLIDLAPTFLEVAGLHAGLVGMRPLTGRSLADIFRSTRSGQVSRRRDHVLIGKERHDVGRPHDWGYPIRGIVKDGWLYLRNFETNRWPAGNPETGYLNCDGSPTKTLILESRTTPGQGRFWQLAFGKRPDLELYHLPTDPDCLANLAAAPQHRQRRARLERQLVAELEAQGDPRMFGQGHRFDAYPYAHDDGRNFYERFVRGEPVRAGWVNPTDFEPHPLD